MSRNLPSRRDQQRYVDGVTKRIREQSPPELMPGHVVGVFEDNTISVKIAGSRKSTRALITKGANIAPGDRVVIASRIPGMNFPIALFAYGGEGGGGGSATEVFSSSIAPPTGIVPVEWGTKIGIRWSVPVGMALAFEIHYGAGATQSDVVGSATPIVIKGGYFFVEANDGDTYWFRIRSLNKDNLASGWSQWISATATAETFPASSIELSWTDALVFADENGLLDALPYGTLGQYLTVGTNGLEWVTFPNVYQVKASANDSIPNTLFSKLVAGGDIEITEINDGGNEKIEISLNVSEAQGVVGNFTDLGDVPASYTGHGEKLVAVNVAENALEFIDAPSGGGGTYELVKAASSPTVSLPIDVLSDSTGIIPKGAITVTSSFANSQSVSQRPRLVDGSIVDTFWSYTNRTNSDWIEFDLGAAYPVSQISFYSGPQELASNHTREYQIVYWDGSAWVGAASGELYRHYDHIVLDPVSAQRWRVKYMQNGGWVILNEVWFVQQPTGLFLSNIPCGCLVETYLSAALVDFQTQNALHPFMVFDDHNIDRVDITKPDGTTAWLSFTGLAPSVDDCYTLVMV